MLLSLRSLWETTGAAAVVEVIVTGDHKNRRSQRILRRLAQWSEAISLPRIAVVIKGVAFSPLQPVIASGTVVITRHVAVYSKGIMPVRLGLAGFKGVDVSIETEFVAIKSAILSGQIETKIDLLKEEITALAMLAA